MKRLYIGTNLKMYKNIRETCDYLAQLEALTRDLDRDEVCLFAIPSYTALHAASGVVSRGAIMLGAQNMHWEEKGQFTGEISPPMLQEIGIEIAEIGHSERRQLFGESDETVNKKVHAALRHGFTALICVGETAREKELGVADERLRIQVKIALHQVEEANLDRIWVAYEPVWAIGVQGIPAEPEYANEKHQVIRTVLKELFPQKGREVPILYGGSVHLANALSFISQPEVDGLFIGRFAWNAESFNELIRAVLLAWRTKTAIGKE